LRGSRLRPYGCFSPKQTQWYNLSVDAWPAEPRRFAFGDVLTTKSVGIPLDLAA